MAEPARCVCCEEKIEPYQADLHHFVVKEGREVDICDDCAKRLADWQGKRLARLFPTRRLKQHFGKKKTR